jgi:hypothetical protein
MLYHLHREPKDCVRNFSNLLLRGDISLMKQAMHHQ